MYCADCVNYLSRDIYLGLQVDTGKGHLGHLVETDGERDGTEHEKGVVNGDTHQDDCLNLRIRHFNQQSTSQIHQEEEQTSTYEDQVQREPETERQNRDREKFLNSLYLSMLG